MASVDRLKAFRLLDLPAELRLMDNNSGALLVVHKPNNAILDTCKGVYAEARKIIHATAKDYHVGGETKIIIGTRTTTTGEDSVELLARFIVAVTKDLSAPEVLPVNHYIPISLRRHMFRLRKKYFNANKMHIHFLVSCVSVEVDSEIDKAEFVVPQSFWDRLRKLIEFENAMCLSMIHPYAHMGIRQHESSLDPAIYSKVKEPLKSGWIQNWAGDGSGFRLDPTSFRLGQ